MAKENGLEEVVLVQPSSVLVANPKTEEVSEDVKENPSIRGMLLGVTPAAFAGATFGVIGATVIPRAVKFGTGWKGVLATAVVAVGGAWLISKLSKPAAVGWLLTGGALVVLQILKWVLGEKGAKFLGADYDWEDYDEGTEGFGEEIFDDEIFGEDEIFGVSQDLVDEDEIFGADRIIPTAGGIDSF